MTNRRGKSRSSDRFSFSWAPKPLHTLIAAMKLKDACSLKKKSSDKPRWCIKKQRHHFTNKDPYFQTVFFTVVMYRCEIWTRKKAEHQRIDVFKLWCWRKLLRIPWTARRLNQSILEEISPEYSLKGQCRSQRSNTLTTWLEEPTH